MDPNFGDKLTLMVGQIDERTHDIQRDVAEIKESLKTSYVRKAEFRPVKTVVFGLVGITLVAVLNKIIQGGLG